MKLLIWYCSDFLCRFVVPNSPRRIYSAWLPSGTFRQPQNIEKIWSGCHKNSWLQRKHLYMLYVYSIWLLSIHNSFLNLNFHLGPRHSDCTNYGFSYCSQFTNTFYEERGWRNLKKLIIIEEVYHWVAVIVC